MVTTDRARETETDPETIDHIEADGVKYNDLMGTDLHKQGRGGGAIYECRYMREVVYQGFDPDTPQTRDYCSSLVGQSFDRGHEREHKTQIIQAGTQFHLLEYMNFGDARAESNGWVIGILTPFPHDPRLTHSLYDEIMERVNEVSNGCFSKSKWLSDAGGSGPTLAERVADGEDGLKKPASIFLDGEFAIILCTHTGGAQDIKTLDQQYGVPPGTFTLAVDSSNMAEYLEQTNPGLQISLGNLIAHFAGKLEYPHNDGNDAAYTTFCVMHLLRVYVTKNLQKPWPKDFSHARAVLLGFDIEWSTEREAKPKTKNDADGQAVTLIVEIGWAELEVSMLRNLPQSGSMEDHVLSTQKTTHVVDRVLQDRYDDWLDARLIREKRVKRLRDLRYPTHSWKSFIPLVRPPSKQEVEDARTRVHFKHGLDPGLNNPDAYGRFRNSVLMSETEVMEFLGRARSDASCK
ncbi:hypothetical protein LTR86_002395 [Recurvomyces mirabilis]|nr:hypothetical protein LTR86_002395 [Recurvomyces mirabilis]